VVLAFAIGCAQAASTAGPARISSGSSPATRHVAPGITYYQRHDAAGPWAIHVLDVERDSCYSAVAIKSERGRGGAVGRARTSDILRALGDSAVGGVNADFFLFAPPGVPTGAMISSGRVVTGPGNQPVLAFDSTGAPHILRLRSFGEVVLGGERFSIDGWNRRVPNGVAYMDAAWGSATDSASDATEVVLAGSTPMRMIMVDTSVAGVRIPSDGGVIVARGSASHRVRAALGEVAAGDSVALRQLLGPWHPAQAVGGRPVLVRDSAIASDTDTASTSFALNRHPRTAVGIAAGGKRLLLVVVDGRQAPYSDGMTLRELAALLLTLGAHDAINLDGGGSSTMVMRDGEALRVANRPSDPTGERAVGNALAIGRGCRR
jgi:hypothetical protein